MPSPPPCPPAAISRLQALADQCVQCGLCLPTCPTYALEGLETESPRGRIALIKALDSNLTAPTPTSDAHLDACLGCRRCEAVCPAHVEYGEILDEARRQQRQRRAPDWRQRLAETLATRPTLRRALLSWYRRLWPWLPQTLRPLPRPETPVHRPSIPVAASRQGRVAVFTGCFAEPYETSVRAAIVRLLDAIGFTAHFPDPSQCCGAIHRHAGDPQTADHLAAALQATYRDETTILGLASGCHASLTRSLGERVSDASAFLARHADALSFAPRSDTVALHLPCTQRNVARSDGALRTLLARVPGLKVIVLDAGPGCCGAAGTAMLTDPVRARHLRQPLLDQLVASGASRLLSANIGCRLHLGNGTTLPVQHPLAFLADCLR